MISCQLPFPAEGSKNESILFSCQNFPSKLQNKIQTNINVTDPANFKDVKPAVTHKQLLRVSKAIET